MNAANLLTSLRIFIVPFFVACMQLNQNSTLKIVTFWLFVAACLTDALDGMIARKFNLISNFGKFFDPLADKILVISAMICLVDLKLFSSVCLIIIVAREFLVTSLRLATNLNGKVIAANNLGKIKTILQTTTTAFLLFNYAYGNILTTNPRIGSTYLKFFQPFSSILVTLTVIATVVSGATYFKQNFKIFLQPKL